MKPKELENTLGKILAFTKQVYLKGLPDDCALAKRFFAGNGKRSPFPYAGFGFEWWLTKRGLELCEDIANMAISFEPQLRGGDRKSFCEAIQKLLEENALNTEIFNGDRVIFREVENLFEARSVENAKEFASKLWSKIYHTLTKLVLDWLVLYPLCRIKAQSCTLGFDGLSLLASNDLPRWSEYAERYSDAKAWNPSTGEWIEGMKLRSFKDFPFEVTWLVCEAPGTQLGSRELAGRRMRTFLTVLFSRLDSKVPNLLSKSLADKVSYSVQFPSDGTQAGCGQVNASIGNLLPPLLVDVDLSPEIISKVESWYLQRSLASDLIARRATTASHFIHYGIASDDLERFLHFFIALDALFGERNKVEQAIKDGVKQTFQHDSTWEKRTEWLFELRSELVHGGVSSINDWKDLECYRRHFKSHPLVDVKTAAMTALRTYFNCG